MVFLTLTDFLNYFDDIKMSRAEFVNTFRVTYRNNPTLAQLLDAKKITNRQSVVKSLEDQRYLNRDRVVDYFYDVLITNRYKYLTQFYNSYFNFRDPYTLKWNADVLTRERPLDQDVLARLNTLGGQGRLTTRQEKEFDEILEEVIDTGLETVSVQKNDAMRIMIRNLNYLDILYTTRITNTSKCRVSFWETLLNVYNKLTLEDRFFAPSSIGLYLREKKGEKINYNNFFYLFQQYQPKASILNPYTIYFILERYFDGSRLFTPVLSWSSYLSAFFHTDYTHYVGVDVIPRVCDRARGLADYYKTLRHENKQRQVDIWCKPSESLLDDRAFLKQYTNFFDSVLWCPPYFDMEIYDGDEQSISLYPDYQNWLEQYFEQTVQLVDLVCQEGATIGVVMNDYYTLDGKYYPLIADFNKILLAYFELVHIVELVNRTSPLRVNKKSRTEKLFLYRK